MTRAGLGTLFFGWMWGVPFLLIVGLIRRDKDFPATGYLTAALVLDLVVPIGGLLLARLLSDRFWARQFEGALVGMAALFLAWAVIAGSGGSPEPAPEPSPRVSRCVQFSGGHQCPGG
ncbi:hypothetical protein GCM10010168_78390 [Actinoplanes ianthinogenes]|uniref:Uncharacterized protein n=1 Tax=Actinoplanes ianthinogenes TaxID=122358 RepID=A0ABM7LKE0_9ACTN|nr:hypothetical protein [Actinoplanes ianthinogenes]BCJ39705.1 hypothetical protein Aiant_03620 [Actinoplanes ianthinogenes]GGR47992.1 hypothetical protein GCM10010168_78390 [Actinoplanes ianthinogenes]